MLGNKNIECLASASVNGILADTFPNILDLLLSIQTLSLFKALIRISSSVDCPGITTPDVLSLSYWYFANSDSRLLIRL